VSCTDNFSNTGSSGVAALLVDTTGTAVLVNTTTSITTNTSVYVASSSPAANVTMANGTTNVTLNLSAVYNSTTYIATVTNAMTVNASTSLGSVVVQFPAGETITGASDWSGVLNLPYVTSSYTAPTNTGTNVVYGAVELGLTGMQLNFSSAVRILIPGAADKLAGFSRGGTFTQITNTCLADLQSWADANVSSGSDCKTTVGNDLAIWTKHFTTFLAYTNTPPSSGTTTPTNGGNNGGGSFSGSAPLSSDEISGEYLVGTKGDGRNCSISVSRKISSSSALSTITTKLTNNGASICDLANFAFADTVPDNFPTGMNEITFVPAYASKAGWTATFAFPSFASGESKTLTYSVAKWVPTSRIKNFTNIAMSADAKVAAAPPEANGTVQPATPVCGNGKLEAGEECDASIACPTGKKCNLNTCKCVAAPPAATTAGQNETIAPPIVPVQKGGIIEAIVSFAGIIIAIAIVLAAVYFLVTRKKKRGLGSV
jgi:hypothetical protein